MTANRPQIYFLVPGWRRETLRRNEKRKTMGELLLVIVAAAAGGYVFDRYSEHPVPLIALSWAACGTMAALGGRWIHGVANAYHLVVLWTMACCLVGHCLALAVYKHTQRRRFQRALKDVADNRRLNECQRRITSRATK